MEDDDYEDYYEDELITCTGCNTVIYNSDPYSFDREGNHLCETCCTGLVEVFYAKYHSNGIYFDMLCASIPPEEVVTLHVQVDPACTVAGITIPARIEERRYDSTNLPAFVELHEGTYRYITSKRIAF